MDAEVHHSELDFTGLKLTGLDVPMMMSPTRSISDSSLGAVRSKRSA